MGWVTRRRGSGNSLTRDPINAGVAQRLVRQPSKLRMTVRFCSPAQTRDDTPFYRGARSKSKVLVAQRRVKSGIVAAPPFEPYRICRRILSEPKGHIWPR